MTREERIEAALATVGKTTPEPWEVKDVGFLQITVKYGAVAELFPRKTYSDPDSPIYNATLIAAAPDLRDEVIALRAQVERQRWFSVKERLPETYELVLATDITQKEPAVFTVFFIQGIWACGGFGFERITHWRPLPEPPQIESEEDKL